MGSEVDSRFGGISSLAIDHGRFLAVSDRSSSPCSITRHAKSPKRGSRIFERVRSLGKKWARDAERSPPIRMGAAGTVTSRITRCGSMIVDFSRTSAIRLSGSLVEQSRCRRSLADDIGLPAFGENGREAVLIQGDRHQRIPVHAAADIAEAATEPDGRPGCCCAKKLSGHHPIGCADYSNRERLSGTYSLAASEGCFRQLRRDGHRTSGGMAACAFGSSPTMAIESGGTLLVALDYVPADTTKARRPPAIFRETIK